MSELLLIALVLLALGRARRGGEIDGPIVEPPKPGPPKPKPTNGPKPKPGDPGGGRVWGSGAPPAGWDPAGNQLYISPDCTLVLEGEAFEPRSRGVFAISAIEESTLADTLAIPGNSVYGYIDWLLTNTALSAPEQIALQVAREANALCADLPPGQRPVALQQWLASFEQRIAPHVYGDVIPFGED